MTPADVHTLTGAYAADALDPEERAHFEEHLRDCPACRDEVAELSATAARLALAVAEPAPERLRSSVLAAAAGTRQLPPAARAVALKARQPWYRQPATVAAALLLVVAAGLGAWALAAERAADRAERIVAVATDPGAVRVVVPIAGGGTGTLLTADGRTVLRTTPLRDLPGDRVYQLWVLDPRAGPQSAGVLGRGGRLEALVEDVGAGDGMGLTAEPAGGSAAPTGDLLLMVEDLTRPGTPAA